MATSYPDRTNARGIWRLSDITRNIKTEGTFPGSGGASRGLVAGGGDPSQITSIEVVNIKTTGNATSFGTLGYSNGTSVGSVQGNAWRGIYGGANPSANTIHYIQHDSGGTTADFGDLSVARLNIGGGSNETRAVFMGGGTPGKGNVCDYISISTTGNAVDFGDLSTQRRQTAGNCSYLRAFAMGGDNQPGNSDVMDMVTIATTGNATDFGNLVQATASCPQGTGSVTRGLNGGGQTPTYQTLIHSFQYMTLGDCVDFGDLTSARRLMSAFSDTQRGVWASGLASPGVVNVIDYVTISSAGNATDFGDVSSSRDSPQSGADSHQGLTDFYPRPPELYSPTGRPVIHGDTAGLGDIGLFQSGGYGYVKTIDYIKISSEGNGTDFGDTATSGTHQAGAGSSTRAFQACFASPGLSTNIDYGLFSTKGNHADFGDTTDARDKAGGLSNNTRACWLGGRDNTSNDNVVNVIDYITMATIGNASDFGDLSAAKNQSQGLASNTRGVVGGGATPSEINVIEYITIGSTGNATDFGDLSVTRSMGGGTGASSTTRGVFAGGTVPGGSNSDVIDYITISSTGNATDFGDLAFVTSFASGLSNNTRAVFSGFNNTSAPGANTTFGQTPHISYVTIASTGDITNFGDLSEKRYGLAAASNGHGGLS